VSGSKRGKGSGPCKWRDWNHESGDPCSGRLSGGQPTRAAQLISIHPRANLAAGSFLKV
jgi:hypothetical protein